MDISKKYFTKKELITEDECIVNKKKCKIPSRNNYVSSAKPSISERKSSVSSSRKKCAAKNQSIYKVDSSSNLNGKQIHTARVNLSQMNNSPSRLNINAQGDKISAKYGYFGGQKCEQYHTRLNSKRNTACNSKIISSASIIHSSRCNKENQSRNEKSSSVNKNKKYKQDQQSKPVFVKRKKSKSRENGSSTTRENCGHKLKDQILHYLEKYIKRDNNLGCDQEIADQIFEERLAVLKEFL